MGLTAKKTDGGSYEIIPEETYQGICYAVYDLGTHYNETFGKSNHKIRICWEIPELRIELDKDGQQLNLPRAISKEYTLSLHEKSNLRKDLESWRGKAFTDEELDGFDLLKLLGVNCMLQIIHSHRGDKTYANVAQVSKLYRNVEKLPNENPLVSFSFETDQSLPDNTPDWIADKIKASNEWQAQGNQSVDNRHQEEFIPAADENGEAIPF